MILAIARTLLVAMFIFSGLVKFMDLTRTAAHIAGKGLPAPMLLAACAGALEVTGGVLVMIGYRTREAALALALFSIATAILFHDFWNQAGREQVAQMLNAWENVSVAGGLVFVAFAGPGPVAVEKG